MTNKLDGGNGNDSLYADSTALAAQGVLATNILEGGEGNDSLTARMTAGVGYFTYHYGFDVLNFLTGGDGNDSLEAYIEVRPSTYGELPLPPVENRLEGGGGNDVLVATIAAGTVGSSFLDGGAGNDRLTVIGGSGNMLNGGEGRDWLTGGIGDDQLNGGTGRDTFQFDLSVNQGADIILDFESRRDTLSFSGLSDQGVPGLVDDLNGISTITDFGLGNDVLVEFNSGSDIVFSGLGTGSIDTWSDMVFSPTTQLVGSASNDSHAANVTLFGQYSATSFPVAGDAGGATPSPYLPSPNATQMLTSRSIHDNSKLLSRAC